MAGANSITLRLPDEESLEMVRAILAYESLVRGCKAGRALADLVLEAADIEHYPAEVLDYLREVGGDGSGEAVGRLLTAR